MKTKTTHTPGPWHITNGIRGMRAVRDASDNIPCICTVYDTGHGGADARLIAAAPDLLEAAKLALANHRLARNMSPCPCAGCQGLRAAIDKAEGR